MLKGGGGRPTLAWAAKRANFGAGLRRANRVDVWTARLQSYRAQRAAPGTSAEEDP